MPIEELLNGENEQTNLNNSTLKSNKQQRIRKFYRKYFLDGQKLANVSTVENGNCNGENYTTFDKFIFVKYRKFFALLIPFSIAHLIWWCTAVKYNFFALYPNYWHMPVTMIFGAIIAGMTSEGGGAVAFPVMTFLLGFTPDTARDFSVMIQSTGMTIALIVIVLMQVQVEWRAIIFATIGALPGLIFGLYFIDPIISAPAKKMIFVSVWGSFAISLWILNSERKRTTLDIIENFSLWKAIVLMFGGAIGGIFTSFAGSGVDICIFSTLTLLFRVTEKTATPTTVVLMALISQFCFFWRAVIVNGISSMAWNYLKVSAPVVITFAPLGSFLGSHFHRQTLAFLVYVLEALSYIGFLMHPNLVLILLSITILLTSYVFFTQLRILGQKLLKQTDNNIIKTNAINGIANT